MQRISVFDMLKIGVGPSSSHTMGPWRAAERFLREQRTAGHFNQIEAIEVHLYGSLAKTGRGHGTDIAVLMGLMGEDPVTCDTSGISDMVHQVRAAGKITLAGERTIPFNPDVHLDFHFDERLPFHPNGIRLTAFLMNGESVSAIYYSIGGGFIVTEDEFFDTPDVVLPYPCDTAHEIQDHCKTHGLTIAQMVFENEQQWRDADAVRRDLLRIWRTMLHCVYRGCHTSGQLPGGLNVTRRAPQIHRKLIGDAAYAGPDEWLSIIKSRTYDFQQTVNWLSCFALAVNEENASFGRVVTAPTNGAAGVLPAVLLYYAGFYETGEQDIINFLLVAGEIGSLFKKRATISAAQGGCQAEIGVSSAMAAAAVAECLGGSVEQALMAAEIAMEHHLGLTCDPVGGLVQIPCIERNAMGAMKAITAANLALESNPSEAKVSLDSVIKTMWETARDMSDKYKETAEGGLAVNIAVNVIEC